MNQGYKAEMAPWSQSYFWCFEMNTFLHQEGRTENPRWKLASGNWHHFEIPGGAKRFSPNQLAARRVLSGSLFSSGWTHPDIAFECVAKRKRAGNLRGDTGTTHECPTTTGLSHCAQLHANVCYTLPFSTLSVLKLIIFPFCPSASHVFGPSLHSNALSITFRYGYFRPWNLPLHLVHITVFLYYLQTFPEAILCFSEL